jgi:hypothetical protein
MAKAKKGDLVALETTHTDRGKTRSEWTLVKVASATRDGIVKAIECPRLGVARKPAHMCGRPRVHTLGDKQDNARRLLASRSADDCSWTNKDELRAAILAA